MFFVEVVVFSSYSRKILWRGAGRAAVLDRRNSGGQCTMHCNAHGST